MACFDRRCSTRSPREWRPCICRFDLVVTAPGAGACGAASRPAGQGVVLPCHSHSPPDPMETGTGDGSRIRNANLIYMQVSNRRWCRWLNNSLLLELVPQLDADEIKGLFAPPSWGEEPPLSAFCMMSSGPSTWTFRQVLCNFTRNNHGRAGRTGIVWTKMRRSRSTLGTV